MNVRTICLAILQLGDATGYEIRKHVAEGHFCHFVDASFGSIYPALSKLEAEGLLDARIEEQAGRPNRRVFSINKPGRDALANMLAQPAGEDIFRSQFLLLAMYAQYMPREHVVRAIDAQAKFIVNELDMIDEAEAQMPLAGAPWVANCGRTVLQAQLDYIFENRQQLEDIAGTSAMEDPLTEPAMQAAE
ncbi:MAG: PadR family transcriptional regulator [Pseudomonadota bacterium]